MRSTRNPSQTTPGPRVEKRTYWLDEIDVGLPDESVVALEHSLDLPASLYDVSGDSPEEPDVSVGVDKQFEVHHIPEALVDQGENTLEQNEVRALYFDPWLVPLARLIVVPRDDHVLPLGQLLDRFTRQIEVEGVGMVEVVFANILQFFISAAVEGS